MSKLTLAARLALLEDTPDAIALRRRSYALLPPDGVIVDVGCGAGRAVSELGARAIGFDVSPEMVDVALRRFPDADIRLGDATALPLPDGSVRGYRADKVLHDLPDPTLAVAEAARVLAPGGRVVLVGHDWDAVIIEPGDGTPTRRFVQERADRIASPRAARAYRNMLLDLGFHDVEVEVHTPVLTGPAALHVAGEIAADPGRLLVAVPTFLATGSR